MIINMRFTSFIIIILVTITMQKHLLKYPRIPHTLFIQQLKTQRNRLDEIKAYRRSLQEYQDQQYNTHKNLKKKLLEKYNAYEDYIKKKQLQQIAKVANDTLQAQKLFQEDLLNSQLEKVSAIQKLQNLKIKKLNQRDARLDKRLREWQKQNKIEQQNQIALLKKQQINRQNHIQRLKNKLNKQIKNFKKKDEQIKKQIQNDIFKFERQIQSIAQNQKEFARYKKQSRLARKQYQRKLNQLRLQNDKRYINIFHPVLGY